MNKLVNTFLLAVGKLMIELHLRQLGFTYSACGPFSKSKERVPKIIETGIHNIFFKTS